MVAATTITAVAAVASAAVGVASSVKGMQAQKKQANAASQANAENAAATKAFNEDSIDLLARQQAKTQEFRDASYQDTRNYTFQKGLKTLAAQKDMGWERLALAGRQAQESVNLTRTQADRQLGLAAEQYGLKETQLAERNRLQEGQLEGQTRADLGAKAKITDNQIAAANEQWATSKKELAMKDEAAVVDHANKQAARALEQRIGIGKLVVSDAARGVTGGAATAAKMLGRQLAIQNAADENTLRLTRGLYNLAGVQADQQRYRQEQDLRLSFERERTLGRLQIDHMKQSNALGERQLARADDLEYAGLRLNADQAVEKQTFSANKALEGQYLDTQLGLKAGMIDLNTRLADLDFQHGQDSAEAALKDGFQMEQAQLTGKHNVTLADISSRYNQTNASISASAGIWQGMAGISSSLFNGISNYNRYMAPSTPSNTSTPQG